MVANNDFAEICGARLEYYLIPARKNQLPTLVFLHEGLGCTALWRDFPENVASATGCAVLVYSRQGYGRSDAAELPRQVDYMHVEAQRVLPGLLKALDIGPHILVGHSDGASIALINAGSRHIDNLKGLILEAPHVFVEDISVKSIAAAKTAYEKKGLRDGLAKYHENVDNTFYGWNDIWLHPDFLEWNIEEFLPHIKVPTLVIQGEQDQYGTQKQVESIERNILGKFEKVILPDCRHAPHQDQLEATLTSMSDFILSLADRGRT